MSDGVDQVIPEGSPNHTGLAPESPIAQIMSELAASGAILTARQQELEEMDARRPMLQVDIDQQKANVAALTEKVRVLKRENQVPAYLAVGLIYTGEVEQAWEIANQLQQLEHFITDNPGEPIIVLTNPSQVEFFVPDRIEMPLATADTAYGTRPSVIINCDPDRSGKVTSDTNLPFVKTETYVATIGWSSGMQTCYETAELDQLYRPDPQHPILLAGTEAIDGYFKRLVVAEYKDGNRLAQLYSSSLALHMASLLAGLHITVPAELAREYPQVWDGWRHRLMRLLETKVLYYLDQKAKGGASYTSGEINTIKAVATVFRLDKEPHYGHMLEHSTKTYAQANKLRPRKASRAAWGIAAAFSEILGPRVIE